MEKHEFVAQEVAEYEARVGELPVHNRGVLREMKEKEFDIEERSNRDFFDARDYGEEKEVRY